MQRQQLIVGHTMGLRRSARLRRTDRSRLRPQVHHHDLVAETVHLEEGVIGERAHVSPLLSLYMVNTLPLARDAGIMPPEPLAGGRISLTVRAPTGHNGRRAEHRAPRFGSVQAPQNRDWPATSWRDAIAAPGPNTRKKPCSQSSEPAANNTALPPRT